MLLSYAFILLYCQKHYVLYINSLSCNDFSLLCSFQILKNFRMATSTYFTWALYFGSFLRCHLWEMNTQYMHINLDYMKSCHSSIVCLHSPESELPLQEFQYYSIIIKVYIHSFSLTSTLTPFERFFFPSISALRQQCLPHSCNSPNFGGCRSRLY